VQPVLGKDSVSCHNHQQVVVGRFLPDLRARKLRPDYKGEVADMDRADRIVDREGPHAGLPHDRLFFTPAYAALVPTIRRVDGRSLWPLLQGRPVEWPERMIFARASPIGNPVSPDHAVQGAQSAKPTINKAGMANRIFLRTLRISSCVFQGYMDRRMSHGVRIG
jgi:hypothetical protein